MKQGVDRNFRMQCYILYIIEQILDIKSCVLMMQVRRPNLLDKVVYEENKKKYQFRLLISICLLFHMVDSIYFQTS